MIWPPPKKSPSLPASLLTCLLPLKDSYSLESSDLTELSMESSFSSKNISENPTTSNSRSRNMRQFIPNPTNTVLLSSFSVPEPTHTTTYQSLPIRRDLTETNSLVNHSGKTWKKTPKTSWKTLPLGDTGPCFRTVIYCRNG